MSLSTSSHEEPQQGMRRYLELVYDESFVDGYQTQKCIVEQIKEFVQAVKPSWRKSSWSSISDHHHRTAVRLLECASTVFYRCRRRVVYFDLHDILKNDPNVFGTLCRRIAIIMLARRCDSRALMLFENTVDEDLSWYLTSNLSSIRIVDFPYPNGIDESLFKFSNFLFFFGELNRFKETISGILCEEGCASDEYDFDEFRDYWAPNKTELLKSLCSPDSGIFAFKNNSILWSSEENADSPFNRWCDLNIQKHYDAAVQAQKNNESKEEIKDEEEELDEKNNRVKKRKREDNDDDKDQPVTKRPHIGSGSSRSNH